MQTDTALIVTLPASTPEFICPACKTERVLYIAMAPAAGLGYTRDTLCSFRRNGLVCCSHLNGLIPR